MYSTVGLKCVDGCLDIAFIVVSYYVCWEYVAMFCLAWSAMNNVEFIPTLVLMHDFNIGIPTSFNTDLLYSPPFMAEVYCLYKSLGISIATLLKFEIPYMLELMADLLEEQPEEETSLENIIVVDNAPIEGSDRNQRVSCALYPLYAWSPKCLYVCILICDTVERDCFQMDVIFMLKLNRKHINLYININKLKMESIKHV